jgi:hypothetical protein
MMGGIGKSICSLNLAEAETKLKIIALRRLNLYMPSFPIHLEGEVTTVSIARDIWFRWDQWHYFEPQLRNPSIASDHIRPEFFLKKPVGMHLPNDTHEVQYFRRWPPMRSLARAIPITTGTSPNIDGHLQGGEFVIACTGAIWPRAGIQAIKQIPVT